MNGRLFQDPVQRRKVTYLQARKQEVEKPISAYFGTSTVSSRYFVNICIINSLLSSSVSWQSLFVRQTRFFFFFFFFLVNHSQIWGCFNCETSAFKDFSSGFVFLFFCFVVHLFRVCVSVLMTYNLRHHTESTSLAFSSSSSGNPVFI